MPRTQNQKKRIPVVLIAVAAALLLAVGVGFAAHAGLFSGKHNMTGTWVITNSSATSSSNASSNYALRIQFKNDGTFEAAGTLNPKGLTGNNSLSLLGDIPLTGIKGSYQEQHKDGMTQCTLQITSIDAAEELNKLEAILKLAQILNGSMPTASDLVSSIKDGFNAAQFTFGVPTSYLDGSNLSGKWSLSCNTEQLATAPLVSLLGLPYSVELSQTLQAANSQASEYSTSVQGNIRVGSTDANGLGISQKLLESFEHSGATIMNLGDGTYSVSADFGNSQQEGIYSVTSPNGREMIVHTNGEGNMSVEYQKS